MSDQSPFDFIRRQTLAALWYEAERVAHGDAACLYQRCPHKIDMVDLLVAVSRVCPLPSEEPEAIWPN